MTYAAAETFDMSDWEREDIADHASEPDDFGCEDCSTDWIPGIGDFTDLVNAVELAAEKVSHEAQHPPFHFYWANPGDLSAFDEIVSPAAFGGAPGEAQYMMNEAYGADYSFQEREYLAWAIHYIQDLAQPLHTGAVWQQLNPAPEGCNTYPYYKWWVCDQYFNPLDDLHYIYEQWAAENFKYSDYDDEYLDDPFQLSFNTADTFDISNTEDACKDLAVYSSQYSTDVWDAVISYGANAAEWPDMVYEHTHNCMHQAGGYTRGLINKFYDIDGGTCAQDIIC